MLLSMRILIRQFIRKVLRFSKRAFIGSVRGIMVLVNPEAATLRFDLLTQKKNCQSRGMGLGMIWESLLTYIGEDTTPHRRWVAKRSTRHNGKDSSI
jgi:hypothetical protein